MPAMRTDLGFGGLMTPAGYYDEMIMGGGGGEAVPAEAAPPAALPAPGVAGGYSSYVPPEQAAPPPTEMPPAGIAGGYGSTDPYAGQAPPPMDQAVGPAQDPYGAYGAAQPLPFNPNASPLDAPNPAPYTGPNYLSEPAGDLATMPGSVAYGGTNLSTLERRLGGRSVQPAGDPYVTQLPGTGDGIGITPTPFSPTLDRRVGVLQQAGQDMAAQQGVLRNLLGPNPTQQSPSTLGQTTDPYAQPPVTLDQARPNTQGRGTVSISTLGGDPDWSWTQNMDQPVVDPNLFPQSMQDEMIGQEQWRPEQYQWDPASSQANGGWDIAGTALRGIVDPIASGVGGAFATTNDRLVAQDERLAAQREAQDARDAAARAAAVGAPGGLVDSRPPAPTIMGPGGAGTGQPPLAPSWNIPQNARDAISEAIAAPFAAYGENRSDIMTLPEGSQGSPRTTPQIGGASAGAATPVVNDGDVSRNRASKLLTPDLQFVNSERTSDAWGAGTGSNQARVITGTGTDRYGTDALVTPESLQAAEAAGMATWVLDEAEFQVLVDNGLATPEQGTGPNGVIGRMILAPKDWVDALGGVPAAGDGEALTNVQDVVATDPYAGGSGGGGGSTWNGSGGGGGWKNYGRGGGGGAWGSGGGWSDWGSSGGDLSAAPAWETSDEGSPFDNPIFARYFDVLSRHFGADRANAMMRGGFGRSLGRKGRSRRVGGKRMTTKGRTSVSVPGGASVEFGGDSIRKSVNASVGQATGKGKKDN